MAGNALLEISGPPVLIKPECTEFAFIIAVVVVLTYISMCVISAEECQTDAAGG